VTARPIPGTHAQKVILVALELLHEPPASTVTLGDALAAVLDEADDADDAAELDELDELLLHPASSERATAPTTVVVMRTGLLNPGLLGRADTTARCRNRVLDDILARLLCSVLPCFCVRLPLCNRAASGGGPRPRGVGSATMTSGC
jgi:hypothetical protein